ncbi:MAG TPA: 3-deoxy-manno-octulosonate cytidylyltransferase, partial [Candidatus Binatia bacterium]|nr:3-deoxy-manno-octulosonate cytidylyltransferase [Candidatus Binatia bacterium]
WLVNVQGDLPFIRPETIVRALSPMRRNPAVPMGTVCTPIYDAREWQNPNVVKVVTDRAGFAIYFSRAPIPYVRQRQFDPSGKRSGGRAGRRLWGFRHLGLYVYRRDFLLKFARLRPTALERSESLEQLRALENGYRIRVAQVEEDSVEVDTPADLKKAVRYLQTRAH